ncbi:CHAD domain-containing protein [Gemmata sp. JC717]|uniref:CHAD domain-containing protein n=1 Tax=Gemmata algarum TaxID=2975278 RepID=UPI0021BA3C58|nr:CHAD domain-containing protein [Gemmata algarum]MDY3553127.1 CHAD domain-containing protein [Gemmata algarum]
MAEGKWITGLTPEVPVAEAAGRVLAERFRLVRQCLPLAAGRAWEDTEFVHQLRVGTRRAGAALRVFASAFPRKHLKATKEALRALRRAAGGARDWDVFLAALPGSTAFRGPDAEPARDFLLGYAFGERTVAQAHLADAEARHGAEFRAAADALLTRAHNSESADAPATIGRLAIEQLGELMRELTDEAEANPTEPVDLHALRITAKRLRYAIEIFAACFPPFLKDTVYPAVERVQEVLGEVQDAAVGLDRLSDIRGRLGAALPTQMARVKPGLNELASELRAKIPAGREAFAAWRQQWLEMTSMVKLELTAATITG